MLRLIDPDYTKVVELEGVKFRICVLSGALKSSIGVHFRPQPDGSQQADFANILPYLAKGIVEIEGLDKDQQNLSVRAILERIEEADTLLILASELIKFSSLSESESKNLNSSSDTPPAESTGTVNSTAGVAMENEQDASGNTNS